MRAAVRNEPPVVSKHLGRRPLARHPLGDRFPAPTLSHINVGAGKDVTIGELAELIAKVVGYEGRIEFDASKPDGTPRKLMDSGKLAALGWTPKVQLLEGMIETYGQFEAATGYAGAIAAA